MSATPEDGGLSDAERETMAALRHEIGPPTDRDHKWQPMVAAGEVRTLLDAIVRLAARAAAPDEVGGDPCGGLAPGDEGLPLAANVDPLPGSADAERRIAAAADRDARHLRCASCGERALHFIVLNGFDVPACLRHLNMWRAPDFAAAPDALRERVKILLSKYAGRAGWVGYEGPRREAWGEIERDLRTLLDDPALAGRPTGGAT